MSDQKKKSFWKRPEGVTGGLFLGALVIGGIVVVSSFFSALATFFSSTVGIVIGIVTLLLLAFVAIDPKARALVSYMFKSTMRWVTGLFIKIDPIGILKSYMSDLKGNLRKMNKQISQLRGQMHKLKELIINNKKAISTNLSQATEARDNNKEAQMMLKTRKAGRLKKSNVKLEDLYRKMEVLYRVLTKMYENSEIMLEDIQDQVEVKEQERKAIHASHSAMKSAMNIMSGNKDKRAMFDAALEAVADDVSQKVGEMEQFMDLSESFMQSIDLQNGIFEEEGLKMLEKWEKDGASLLLGGAKEELLELANDDDEVLDLSAPRKTPEKVEARGGNQYDNFFE